MSDELDFAELIDDTGQFIDPCAVAKALLAAEMTLISGAQVAKIEYRDRALWTQQANLGALRAMRVEAQAQCAALRGVARPARKVAITAGDTGSNNRGFTWPR